MTNDATFKQFTKQALRTESVVESTTFNTEELISALKTLMAVGELLDYMKKGIFYKNWSKYTDNYERIISDINDNFSDLMCEGGGVKTVVEDHRIGGQYNIRLIHGLLGAITEAAEIAEHLVLHMEEGTIDPVGISEEFEDMGGWYKAVVYDELGLSEEDARARVIEKLRVRFPDAYSDEAAANRDLDKERKALEGN